MSAKRCGYCERLWPNSDAYKECPVCQEPTSLRPADESLPAGIAELEAIRGSFGWWLWDHNRA